MKRIYNILKNILLILLIFLTAFGSKGLILNNLYDYNLVGPDPYLFYQYMIELYEKGHINDYDFNRYYPLGTEYYNRNLVSYLGYISLILLNTFPGFLNILKLYNIIPIARELTWLSANFSIPLFFAISSILFFIFAKKLFKDDILALISSIIFSINSLFTMRIIAFDTELGALPFITLSFLFYYLAIKSEKEKSVSKKIILILILIFGIFLIYYLINFIPNSDHLQTFVVFYLFLFALILYPHFKSSKEYFYVLLVFSTILARKGWGGWIIIPTIIGANEVIRFLLGKENKEFYIYNFFILYFSLLEYKKITLHSFLEIHNLIIVAVSLLYFVETLFNKLKIFEKFKKLNILKIEEKLWNKIILIFIGIFLSFPFTYKHLINLVSPYTDRMITTVAEYQRFSGIQYLKTYTVLGLIASFIGLSYLLWNKKKELDIGISLSASLLLFLSLFFLDNLLSLEISTLIAWISFIPILLIIIFRNKEISEEDLLIITISIICLIIGKYIYRLAFFSGFSISLLFVNSIRWLDHFKINRKGISLFLEITINILLFISAITAFNLFFKYYSETKIIIFPILIPVFFYIYFIVKNYLLKEKKIDLTKHLQYSILFIILYGIYNNFGYITNYFLPIYFSGTEDYIINSMLYLNRYSEEDAIIHFWWDYGYYGRVIANRTVWLSGDNSYPYWNHLMGRYGLSGNNFLESLELLYIHSVYDYKTFKTLELFNKNKIFYDYIYKKVNFTEEELKIIENIKRKLKNEWINLLYKFNGDFETIKEFDLSEEEKIILEKLYNMKYLKPSYLYIDPTDIGKSYQFTKLGSDEMFDKHSWINNFNSLISERDIIFEGIRININNRSYYLLANENRLSYYGSFFLDENIYINGERIPRCIPELNILDCGIIFKVDLIFSEPIIEIKQLRKNLIEEKINPLNIINATLYIFYRDRVYNLSLGCVYFDGILLEFENAEYNGCLYVTPSLIKENRILSISNAFFISQKSRNYTWVRLYFFNEGEPYFRLIRYFYPTIVNLLYGYVPPFLYREVSPAKIWKINYPENFDVPEYKYCLYLATNLEEINKCSEIYGLEKYKSIWEV